MTGTLARYVARLLLTRLALITIGLSALFILIDFLADGDQVLASGQGTLIPILRYIWLRLPGTVSILIPIAALMAGILAFAELARHRELTVIFSAGVPRWRLMLAALPVALAIASIQFLVEDQAVPVAAAELHRWGIGDEAPDPDAFTWIRLGDDVVRYRRSGDDGPELAQVTIYRRAPTGALIEAIQAGRAGYENGSWTLYDVRHSTGEERAVRHVGRRPWPHGPDPSLLADVNMPPDSRSLAELVMISARGGIGDFPLHMYDLALNERLMRPILTILFICLGAALVRPTPHRANIGLFIAAVSGLGLLCWLGAEITASVGGLGLLPPVVAAWGPVAVTALIIAFFVLYENPGAIRR